MTIASFRAVPALILSISIPGGPWFGCAERPLRESSISRSFKRTYSHLLGTSNGISSSAPGGSGLGFASFPSLTSRAFSAVIRSRSKHAGSSPGSCGTSLPRIASWRMACRRGATSAGAVNRSSMRSAMRVQAAPTAPASRASRRAARAALRREARVVSRSLRAASRRSRSAIRASTLATIRYCSARGGRGTGGSECRPVPGCS